MVQPDDGRDEVLDRVAEAVSDGAPVNWDREGDARPELRPELESLRILSRVRDSYSDEETGTVTADPRALFHWGSLVVLERLGAGSFGEVYRAFDPALETQIALKLRKARDDDAEAIEKFLSEARRLARVRHPHVLTVYGADVRDRRVGIWTELIVGETLEEYLHRHGPLGAREAVGIGIDLCRALAAVHAAGLVHRDVKTGNVMRETGGRIVLMDFGSGAELPPPGAERETVHLHGTLAFMAPEQLAGIIAGPPTDIYSLGVVLYRLVTGEFPVIAESLPRLIEEHQRGPVPLRDRRPDLPTEFVRVVHTALARRPEDRYPTTGAMELALAADPGGTRREQESKGPSGSRPRRGWAALAGAATIILAAVGVYLVAHRTKPPGPTGTTALTASASVLRVTGSGDEILPPGARVRPGDRLAMTVQGAAPMYLYVLDQDAQGEIYVLFPLPGLEPRNPLSSGARHRLPGQRGDSTFFWNVTSAGGRESVIALASRRPLAQLEQEIARFPRAALGRPVQLEPNAVLRLRGIGGLTAKPAVPTGASQDLAATLKRSLGTPDEPVWLWQTVLENPPPPSSR